MSLRLFIAPSGTAALHEFDDAGQSTDRGAAFVSAIDGHPISATGASGDAKLREIVQWINLVSDATIAITPVADGVPQPDQTYVTTLALADGQAQRIEVPCSVRGRRFTAALEIRDGLASAIGEAELWIVPKRTRTGGDRP